MPDPGETAEGDRPPLDPEDPLFEFLRGMWELVSREQPLEPQRLRHEVIALLGARPAPPHETDRRPADQARDLVENAWDSEERGPYLALDALRLDPDCADAYVYLGSISGEEPQLAFVLFGLGMMAGSVTLGPEVFENGAGEFWQIPETRPFMRALEGAARTTWELGERAMAVDYYLELLRLNPEDNQGARYALLSLALELQNPPLAASIFSAYDETSAQFAYARALGAFQRAGDVEESRGLLAMAIALNPGVVGFLTGARPLPDEVPAAVAPGSEGEAAICADLFFDAWQQTPGALEWLASASVTAAPAPSSPAPKAKREGPRAID